MAEFGVKATELQDPQARGSAPISPVQEPASSWSIGDVRGLFTNIAKSSDEKPWSKEVNDYYKKANAIQQGVLTGQFSERQGYNKIKMLTTEYGLRVADYGIEAQKALNDSFGYIRTGGTGLGETIEATSQDTKRAFSAADALTKAGVYVPPVSEQSQSDKDFLVRTEAHLASLERTAKESQEAITFRNTVDAANRASQEFQWKLTDRARQEDARNAVNGLKRDSISYIPQMLDNILKGEGTPQEKQMRFEQSMAGLNNVASNVLMADPTSLKVYQETINQLTTLGREMLDPTKDTKKLQDELQRRILTAQLDMTNAAPVLKVAALDQLIPNSPAITMAAGQQAQRILVDDLNKAVTSNVVPSVVANDVPTQKSTFQTIQSTISRVTSGASMNPQADMDAAAKAADATLKTLGMVNANSNVTLEYVKDFIASPEYGELIKAGKYNPDIADQARPAFQDLYVSAFGEKFFTDIGKQIGDVNYVDGKPSPDNATLGKIVDLEVTSDGKIKAVKKIDPSLKITASTVYIDRQIRDAQKMADGLTKVVRAAAHLDGRTDYAKYWEENKHFLARGIFPPPEFIEQLKAKGYSGTGSALNPANYNKQNGQSTNQ